MSAPVAQFPFDAVLFDLDGTLVATDRFWPDAARAGALRAFQELGLDRALPTTAQWMDLVGRPLVEGFDELFHDLDPEQRAHVRTRCVEAEHELLAGGRAGFLPGVPQTLATLRAAGVRTGIASNCGRDYLRAMTVDLGLGKWIEEGRCLDSPGVVDKAGMIEDLLHAFGTRRAVFVGDRVGDRDAAWANGLPHVHLARGYAGPGERVEAEGRIEGLDALVPRLEVRRRAVDELASSLAPARRIGITGGPCAGKTLLAGELRERVEAQVVEGEHLGTTDCDAVVELVVPDAILARRLEGRDVRLGGPPARAAARERLEAHRRRPPLPPGTLRVDAANALGPLRPIPPAG